VDNRQAVNVPVMVVSFMQHIAVSCTIMLQLTKSVSFIMTCSIECTGGILAVFFSRSVLRISVFAIVQCSVSLIVVYRLTMLLLCIHVALLLRQLCRCFVVVNLISKHFGRTCKTSITAWLLCVYIFFQLVILVAFAN